MLLVFLAVAVGFAGFVLTIAPGSAGVLSAASLGAGACGVVASVVHLHTGRHLEVLLVLLGVAALLAATSALIS